MVASGRKRWCLDARIRTKCLHGFCITTLANAWFLNIKDIAWTDSVQRIGTDSGIETMSVFRPMIIEFETESVQGFGTDSGTQTLSVFVRPRTNSVRGFAYDLCCQNHRLNQQKLLSNLKFVNRFGTDSDIGMTAATRVWELASCRNVLVVLARQRRAHG